MRFRGFRDLLVWRQGQVGTRDDRILEKCLTVEGLPHDAVPPKFAADVRRWRKLRTIDRLTVCRNFCWWLRNVESIRRAS